ncbi:MAG: XRE family transcriptional regulator [Pseudomonadota bacterium]
MGKTTEQTDLAGLRLGERVVELRQGHGFTLDQLAAASGVSRSMLSQIERGQANPTLAVTFRIAQAFGLSIGELVDDPSAGSAIEVIRGGDAGHLFRDDDECRIRTLSPLHMEKNMEFYEVLLQPGASMESAPHFEGTRELLNVSTGSAKIVSGSSESILSKGDSAHYRADLEHCISNAGKGVLQAYLVVTYR